MIGENNEYVEAVDSNSTNITRTSATIDDQQTSLNEVSQSACENFEDESFIEQSFEVISTTIGLKTSNMEESGRRNDQRLPNNEDVNQRDTINKPRANSELPKNSFQDKIRKSSGFLTKLQSSSDDNGNQVTNIPSSIVNAFSSFTSNFSLNSSSTNGNNSNNSSFAETASTSTTATTTSRINQTQETKEEIFIKKAALERKNLISLTKLIVKDLISTSLLESRTINDCQNAIHLNNYFTLIDRVLKHGLKQNLLSTRSLSLWNALDHLPKYLKEATLISESVRSLTNTKTPDGKIKAWMRLVMMQKKLPEYFNELLANKNVLLKDIYYNYAFILNDEAYVFAGLIIGVNVIDCNFFVKDANFDLMDDVIELSPYLRIANSYDSEQEELNDIRKSAGPDIEKLTTVLDQKNYLEEWNKRLESTIIDLKNKIKNLENQNSKLEMENKLNEVRINKLQGNIQPLPTSTASSISVAIKNLISSSEQPTQNSNKLFIETMTTPAPSDNVKPDVDATEAAASLHVATDQIVETETEKLINQETESHDESQDKQSLASSYSKLSSKQESNISKEAELQKQLSDQERELNNLKERASILEASYRGSLEKLKILERDLDVQTSINADKETTIMIYEKDIKEKQTQVESLRSSLNDSKTMNSDLNERLNQTNSKLKDRVKSVSTLQASLDKWKLENKILASRLQEKQEAFKSMSDELEAAKKKIEDLKRYNEKINEDLRRERESGHSSSATVESQNARISELVEKLAGLENELTDVKPYRDQTEELSRRCRDYELSLEEIGAQLRESRLEVENLKENSAVYLDSQWMDSKQVKTCALCQQSFSVTRRKHHCRLCGNVFCQTCSDNKMELASSAKPVRVCDTCHSFLLAKFVKSST